MLDPQYQSASEPEHEPIANVAAEAALLGALLQDNARFDVAIEHVSAADFYEPLHRRIFEAVQDAIAVGRLASPITLRPLFAEDPAIQQLGGVQYLDTLTQSPAAHVGARDFARQIGELARTRALHDGALEVLERIRDQTSGVSAARHAADLEALAFNASASKQERSNTFTLSESISRVAAQVRHIQTSGLPVGVVAPDIPELERVLGPLQRKHLTVLAGRPGMGKSALLCGIVRSAAMGDLTMPHADRRRYGVGCVSLEMGDIDLGQRFAADVSIVVGEPVLHAEIRDAKLSAAQLKTLDHCANMTAKLPVRLEDVSGISLSRLFMIARRMKRELEADGFTLDLFAVDYLQLVHGDGNFAGNKTAEITQISQGLKQLAKELDTHVLALSQLSRAVETREIKIPQLSDLRESGSIEQDADNVAFVYRDSYYLAQKEPDRDAKNGKDWEEWRMAMDQCRDHLDIIVPKRRGGANGRAQCTFIKEYQAVRAKDYHSTNPGSLFANG